MIDFVIADKGDGTLRQSNGSCIRMNAVIYKRIQVQSGEHHFCLFCTQASLSYRRDEVLGWVDQLARLLHWDTYETIISTTTAREATEREPALFEPRFPPKP